MGIQPPTRKTSGARPFLPRGVTSGSSDASIGLACLRFPAGLRFRRFPWIAAVEIHPDIAAWAGGSAETDLAPRRGMTVIGHDDVEQDLLGEKKRAVHASPCGVRQLAILSRLKQRILLGRIDSVKIAAVSLTCLGIECGQTETPCLACRGQTRIAIAVAPALEQFGVDHGPDRHRRAARGLRQDASAYRL